MNITYINTQYGQGGAAASTQLLRESLAKRGHTTRALAGYSYAPPTPSCAVFSSQTPGWMQSYCERNALLYYAFQGSHALHHRPDIAGTDIIHFQNMHGGYFNPWSISALSHLKPVVWTLRDMQALTGHCAHAFNCEKWQYSKGCHDCPSLHVYPSISRDSTKSLWTDKKNIYAHSQLWIVAPSTWMLEIIKNSILRDHPVSLIHNAIDTTVFTPQDKEACRKKHGLPADALLVGGSADGGMLRNPWKGGQHVLNTLKILKERFDSLYFVNLGGSKDENNGDTKIITIPYTANQHELTELYSCLDVFLYPTLADTAPLSVREALACGVPVCGFDNGGMPDLIVTGENGYLVASGDDEGLAAATESCLRDSALRTRLGRAARTQMTTEFDVALMAQRYEELYRTVIKMFDPSFCKPFKLKTVHLAAHTPAFYKLERKKLSANPAAHKKRKLFLRFSPVQYIVPLLIKAGEKLRKLPNVPRGIFNRLKKYSGCTRASTLEACRQILKMLFYRAFAMPRAKVPMNRVFGLNMGKSVSRYYIDSFIAEHQNKIKGTVLEVGDPVYASRFPRRIGKLEVLHAVPQENRHATIIGDLASGTGIPEDKYDCFILTQTLQCIYNADDAMRNAYRLLKPGGTLLVTCSGLCQSSVYDRERWGEYWRFTDQSLTRMIAECCPEAESAVRTYGNLAVSKGLLHGINSEKFSRKLLDYTDRDYQVIVAAVITKKY